MMRADVAAEIVQVFIGPGWPYLVIEAGFWSLIVPAKPETVAVRAAGGF
jgi:hypothetical protein